MGFTSPAIFVVCFLAVVFDVVVMCDKRIYKLTDLLLPAERVWNLYKTNTRAWL